jgi:hypothetical protein
MVSGCVAPSAISYREHEENQKEKGQMKIPKRMKQRPKFKGLPIPYIALIDGSGKPDFRVVDKEKWASVVRYGLCQLCGQGLGEFMFFVGGPEAAKGNQYFEPAAHLDCLIYAMQMCPFIIGKIEHADVDKIAAKHADANIQVVKEVLPARCPLWVIVKAGGYRVGRVEDSGTYFIIPHRIGATPELCAEKMKPKEWNSVAHALMKL